MLEVAANAARDQGLTNLETRQMDGANLVVDQPFDAVISRNAMQFLPEWPAPLAGIRAALRPGGCLSFLVWGPIAENPYAALPLTGLTYAGLEPEALAAVGGGTLRHLLEGCLL